MSQLTLFDDRLKSALTKEAIHIGTLKTSRDTAIVLGAELLELKEVTPHGEFEKTLHDYFMIKPRQLRKYMQAASQKSSIRHLNADLDLETCLKLLTIDDEAERIELSETLQDMTQKERSEYLKQIAQLQSEKYAAEEREENWKSDMLKVRAEARDTKLENEKLKAEQTKVIYVTEDEAAIKQIKEEADSKVKAALEAKQLAEKALQTEATRIAEYRLKDRQKEVDSLEARAERAQAKTDEQLAKLAILEQQAKRTEAEYYQVLGKQKRRVQVDLLLEQWAKLEGELGVVLAELFFDDEELDEDQMDRALKRLQISQQNRDQVTNHLNEKQPKSKSTNIRAV